MQYIKLNKSFFGIYLVILSAIPLSACAGKYPPGKGIIPVDASIVISIGPKSGVVITDTKTGQQLERCSLGCTKEALKKYPDQCPEKYATNTCKGLIDATVTDASTITILRSFKNPYCDTVIYKGVATQSCIPPLP